MEPFPEPYIDHPQQPLTLQKKAEPVTRPADGKKTQEKWF